LELYITEEEVREKLQILKRQVDRNQSEIIDNEDSDFAKVLRNFKNLTKIKKLICRGISALEEIGVLEYEEEDNFFRAQVEGDFFEEFKGKLEEYINSAKDYYIEKIEEAADGKFSNKKISALLDNFEEEDEDEDETNS